jgi:hypothetical protein
VSHFLASVALWLLIAMVVVIPTQKGKEPETTVRSEREPPANDRKRAG